MYLETTSQFPSIARPTPPKRSKPFRTAGPRWSVDSEYGRLETVLLADARHLALLPCNAVSNHSLSEGRKVNPDRAARQHAGLVAALRAENVTVRLAPADPGLPDLTFTRDTSLMTPWGLIGLNPGAPHRRREVDVMLEAAKASGVPIFGRVTDGCIEGGDILILRPGIVLIGISGVRTDEAGAAALGAIFRRKGWEVITTHFDPEHLHLDTLFGLAGHSLALACTDVLDPALLMRLDTMGIDLIPAACHETRRLGCNLLALGDRRVISAGSCSRIDAELACRGYRVIAVDLSEFILCGGGAHCLTMPLRRAAG